MITTHANKTHYLKLLLASFVVLGGGVVMLAWHFRIDEIIQVSPAYVPMQYNTALCFLLIGGASLLLFRKYFRLGLILSFLVIVVAGLSLVQYIMKVDIGIDQFFVQAHITVYSPNPGRMAVNTSIAFVLSGVAVSCCCLWRTKLLPFLIASSLSAVILSLGMLAILGYLVNLAPVFPWGEEMSQMAVHTAILFSFVSLALMIHTYKAAVYGLDQLNAWMLISAITISLTGFFVLYLALRSERQMAHERLDVISTKAPNPVRVAPGNGSYFLESSLLFLAVWTTFFALSSNRSRNETKKLLKRNESMLNAMLDGLAVVNEQGMLIQTNHALCNMFGYSDGELEGLSVDVLVQMDIRNIHKTYMSEFFAKTTEEHKVMGLGRNVNGIHKQGHTVPIKITLYKPGGTKENIVFAAIEDLTEKLSVKELLEEKEQFINRALNASFTGIYVYNFQTGANEYINSAYTRITGYSLEEINSMTVDEFRSCFHPDDVDSIFAHMEEVRCSQNRDQVFDIEYRFKHKSGDWVWCLSKDTAFDVTSDGEVLRMIGSFLDITDRKKIEEDILRKDKDLSESEAQYNLAIQGAGVGIWDWRNVNEKQIFWSDRLFELLGYGPGEVDTSIDRLNDLLHPDDLDRVWMALQDHLNSRVSYDVECRFYCSDGRYRWFRNTGKATYDETGNPQRMVGSTELIHRRKELESEQRRLLDILESSTDYISQSDEKNNIIYLNRAFKSLIGVENIEGDEPPQWFSEEVSHIFTSEILPMTNKHGYWSGEIDLKDAYGALIPTSMVHIKHRHELSSSTYFSAVYRDMTEIRNKELALKKSNEELEQFAYIASHDLKEPVRTLDTFSQYLIKDIQSNKQERVEQDIAFIQAACEQMIALIDGLLHLSRAGNEKLNFETSNIHKLFADVQERLAVQIAEVDPKITLETTVDDVVVDPVMMCLVIQNLLQNAIKFRDKQRPLEIGFRCLADGPNQVVIQLQDNGIGIERESLNLVFGIFKKLHPNSVYPGTGIGLAIAEKIIRRHNGVIRVESEVGKGTCFSITLPNLILKEGENGGE